ncbi:hypothetical protein [Cellulomonas sp. URHE0023]|uniref:hypothetical protein n=1 Tax=Cellulomonas sp. URHE0023 TaxID=1380354 RepID=UPI00055288D4|nr:hypothetical protein [Cellulomonas sp. URHE0023]
MSAIDRFVVLSVGSVRLEGVERVLSGRVRDIPRPCGSCPRSTTHCSVDQDDVGSGGRASAKWTVDAATVSVTPLRTVARAERSAVADEGAATASFPSDGESDRVVIGSTP